jgi:hypothetical protein
MDPLSETALASRLRGIIAELERVNAAQARQIEELRAAVAALLAPADPEPSTLWGRSGPLPLPRGADAVSQMRRDR